MQVHSLLYRRVSGAFKALQYAHYGKYISPDVMPVGVVNFLVPQAAESDVLERVYMSGYPLSLRNDGG